MMNAVRLYEKPEEFSEMVMRRLRENMGVRIERKSDEPLLLEIGQEGKSGKLEVSLHETYYTYMASGDLNTAIDYMNDIIRNWMWIRSNKDSVLKLDPAYIFPAVRDERYVFEAGKDFDFLSEPYLPGLRVIYLEIKDQCTKIINEPCLKQNPRLTEEKVKRLAHRNLQSAGWHPSSLVLKSPARPSCTIEVFTDPPHPIDCQFLIPEMAITHLPSRFVIAFTNRKYTLVMHSTEKMDTKQQAKRLVMQSKFAEIVKRNYYLLPHPVSQRIYWVCDGKAELLE